MTRPIVCMAQDQFPALIKFHLIRRSLIDLNILLLNSHICKQLNKGIPALVRHPF